MFSGPSRKFSNGYFISTQIVSHIVSYDKLRKMEASFGHSWQVTLVPKTLVQERILLYNNKYKSLLLPRPWVMVNLACDLEGINRIQRSPWSHLLWILDVSSNCSSILCTRKTNSLNTESIRITSKILAYINDSISINHNLYLSKRRIFFMLGGKCACCVADRMPLAFLDMFCRQVWYGRNQQPWQDRIEIVDMQQHGVLYL